MTLKIEGVGELEKINENEYQIADTMNRANEALNNFRKYLVDQKGYEYVSLGKKIEKKYITYVNNTTNKVVTICVEPELDVDRFLTIYKIDIANVPSWDDLAEDE